MNDVKPQLDELQSRLEKIKVKLNPENRTRQISELEAKTMSPDFWGDKESAQSTMKYLASLQTEEKAISELEKELSDAQSVAEILEEKDILAIVK